MTDHTKLWPADENDKKPLSERVHLADVTDEVPRAYYVCDDDVEDLPAEIAALERKLAEAKERIHYLEEEYVEEVNF